MELNQHDGAQREAKNLRLQETFIFLKKKKNHFLPQIEIKAVGI